MAPFSLPEARRFLPILQTRCRTSGNGIRKSASTRSTKGIQDRSKRPLLTKQPENLTISRNSDKGETAEAPGRIRCFVPGLRHKKDRQTYLLFLAAA